MRYILNKEGYISDVSFGGMIICSLGTCTEYKGKVPNGYSTIEDWHAGEIERLNSWKIVDGNLVFDANRDYKLKILYDQQNNENSHVTRKEMGMASTDEINPYTDLFPSHNTAGGYIVGVDETFNKVGNLPTEEVNLTLWEKQDLDLIELEFIGDNFLPNTAISSTNNGITYTQNKDKTINVSGTATERSTLNLAGTDTSVRNILTLKQGVLVGGEEGDHIQPYQYLLFGLEGLSLEFYNYDGTDRTLVGTYTGGIISVEEDTNITQVVLVVDKGTSIYTTIKPMLKLVSLEYPVMQMTKYTGEGERNGQYYVDGVSTQETRSGKNLCNYAIKQQNTTRLQSDTFSVLPNTTYTISTSRSDIQVTNYYKDIDKKDIKNNYYDNMPYTFTTPENCYYIQQLFKKSDNSTITPTELKNIQLEVGSVATEYEEYTGGKPSPSPDYPSEIINLYPAGTYNAVVDNKIYRFTIPEDLRGLPNGIGDRLWIDVDGGIDIERKVGKVVLDGSENWESQWNSSSEVIYGWRVALENSITYPNNLDTFNPIFSNCFKNYTQNSLFANKGTGKSGICGRANTNMIIISYNDITSTNDFKTWLSTHNTEVYYELATYTTSFLPSYSLEKYEYEEYKNNTTLIDLAGNNFTTSDKITLKDNQIILIKNNFYINEVYQGEETYLGDTVMPRTYTPYTHAYCHQKVYLDFKYKDPRNVDITKINLKGLISITDIETEYNFCEEDLTRIQNYIMGTGELTDEEFEVYDVNGDGVIKATDYVTIQNMINGIISNKVTGTLEINSTQSKRTIVLRDDKGKIQTSLGLNGIFTPSLSIDGVSVEENITYSETPTTQFLNGSRIYKRLYTGQIPSSTGSDVKLFSYDFDAKDIWIDESNSFIRGDVVLGVNWHRSSSDYLRTFVHPTQKQVKYASGANLSSFSYNIVLAYTKNEGTPEEPETPTEEIIEVNKSSTIKGSTSSSNWTFKTVATEESVDTVNKTSTVTITNYIGRPSSNSSSYFMGNLTIKYNCGDQTHSETKYRNSGTISAGGWYKLGSHTFTIKHTEEPMKINVGGSMSTSEFNPSSASASGNITLTEI